MVSTLVRADGRVAALSFFLFGVGPIVWTITSTTLRQSVTPHAMLGRVRRCSWRSTPALGRSARRWAGWSGRMGRTGVPVARAGGVCGPGRADPGVQPSERGAAARLIGTAH
jgi:hypothetical protein